MDFIATPELNEQEKTYINQQLNLTHIRLRTSFQLLLDLKKEANEIIAAELGTFSGVNAYYMLKGCAKLKLYCVDSYDNITIETGKEQVPEYEKRRIMNCANKLLSSFNGKVTRVIKRAEEAYKDFPDGYFDYVYIDADHLYESVKQDIELWYPKVKAGGLLAGHDFAMTGVSRAVTEFRDIHKIGDLSFSNGNGESDWWFVKQPILTDV